MLASTVQFSNNAQPHTHTPPPTTPTREKPPPAKTWYDGTAQTAIAFTEENQPHTRQPPNPRGIRSTAGFFLPHPTGCPTPPTAPNHPPHTPPPAPHKKP